MKWQLVFAASLVLAACSSNSAQPGDGGSNDASIPADLASTDLYGCQDPLNERPDGGACLTSVSGHVVSEADKPLNSTLISVCGDICFYGRTVSDGTFVALIKDHVVLDHYAIEVHGRPDRASWYQPLPQLTSDTLAISVPLVSPLLPATGPAIALDDSAQTIVSGDATLILAANTQVQLDVEDVELMPLGSQLRVLTVSPALLAKLPFVDAAHPPDALFAFAPFEVVFSQKAQVTFANTASLPALAAVDIFSMRGYVANLPPAGVNDRVAGAHVSADGTKIVMDAGEGVTTLTWLALVKK